MDLVKAGNIHEGSQLDAANKRILAFLNKATIT